jgi:hypothetical protein
VIKARWAPSNPDDGPAIHEGHVRFSRMATFEILSAGISGESFTRLHHREQRHFSQCDACGLWYDRRSLAEVVYHASGHNAAAADNQPKVLPGHHLRPGLRRYHHKHHHVRASRAAA